MGDEIGSYSQLFKTAEEIEQEIADIKNALFDFDTENAEEFCRQISQIEDKKQLLALKKALQTAKELYNVLRLQGSHEFLAHLDFDKLNLLYRETAARLDTLNLAEKLQQGDTAHLLNEALEDVYFQFVKIGEAELKLADDLKDIMRKVREGLAGNNGERGLSEPTLYRWVRAYRAAPDSMSRLLALAPVKTREKTPLLAIDWLPYFLMFYQRPNKPTMMAAAKKLAQWYLEQGKIEQMPSYDQIQTVMKRLPDHMKERGRRTGSAYKALLPYIDRDWTALKPNDVWVGDGHSFKAKIRHPMGYLFTPEVTMIVDGCSGAVVGWSVALSETAVAVADALRHGMTHFPPPLGYYSDNGSGETGDMLDKETTGILPRIGIEHFTGIPGNPQGRGKIERLWQTITIPLAKQYATYQGKDADAETLRKVSNALASAQKVQKKGKELSKAQETALAAAPTWAQFMADLEEAVQRSHRIGAKPQRQSVVRSWCVSFFLLYQLDS